MTLLAIFPEQYWIPIGLLAAALWSFYRGYRSSKSNSTTQVPGGIINNTGNVPFVKTSGAIFGFIFLAAAIASFAWMYSDR